MIRWTRHAEERQAEWQKLRGVTRETVEAVLQAPGQVVPEMWAPYWKGEGDAG